MIAYHCLSLNYFFFVKWLPGGLACLSMFGTFWSFTFWSLRMLHFSKCVICRMFILPIWWRFILYIANLTPIQPTWSANDTALLSVIALQRSSASSYTDDFDAVFFITRYGINPYAHYVFLWARCSPWDIKQRVGPSTLGLHLTGDVSSLGRRRDTSMDE